MDHHANMTKMLRTVGAANFFFDWAKDSDTTAIASLGKNCLISSIIPYTTNRNSLAWWVDPFYERIDKHSILQDKNIGDKCIW